MIFLQTGFILELCHVIHTLDWTAQSQHAKPGGLRIVAYLCLMLHVYRWLREEKRQRKQLSNGLKGKNASNKIDLAQWSNGWAPGRMTASIRDSSNTVMRM